MVLRIVGRTPSADIFGPVFYEREKQGAALLAMLTTLLEGRTELILGYLLPSTDAEQDDGKYDFDFQLVAIVHRCDTDWWHRLSQDIAALGYSVQIVTHVVTSLADIYITYEELCKGVVWTLQPNGEGLYQHRECVVVTNKLSQNLPFIVSCPPMVA